MRAATSGRPYAHVFSGAARLGPPVPHVSRVRRGRTRGAAPTPTLSAGRPVGAARTPTFRAYDAGGQMGPPLRDEQARGVRLEVALRAAARDRREDFVEVGDADEVAFVFVEGEFAVRDRLRLVAAHRRRDVDVFAALPEV